MTKMVPICPRCKRPMKRVIYGMPTEDLYKRDDVIFGGCILDGSERAWGCRCEQIPNRRVKFEIVVADITSQDVDVIVNAANPSLEPGGGVCGAIHQAAGPALAQACQRKYPLGVSSGSAVSTKGFNLQAKWVVHAVAPDFRLTGPAGEYLLCAAYRNALLEADTLDAKSVAIPSLGTGIYGWRVEEVAPVVITTIQNTLLELGNVEQVILCCLNSDDKSLYANALSAILP